MKELDISIIKAEKDIENIIKCVDQAFEHSVIQRKNYDELLSKIVSYSNFIVARFGEPCGYVAMYANDLESKTAYITLIGVLPKYQNQHIGKKLLDCAVNIAIGNGMRKMKLEVADSNEKAINFYKKNGFEYAGRCSERSIYMCRAM